MYILVCILVLVGGIVLKLMSFTSNVNVVSLGAKVKAILHAEQRAFSTVSHFQQKEFSP